MVLIKPEKQGVPSAYDEKKYVYAVYVLESILATDISAVNVTSPNADSYLD